jgi:chromosomal replication initiation ATPase DnaA
VSPVEAIVAEVADIHLIRHEDLVGPCHRRDLVDARAEAATRLFEETDLRLWQIGEILGGRHHSSVIHLLRREPRAAP